METYRFDEKRKILYMSKLPIDTEFHGYKVSDHYKAYTEYLYKGRTADLAEISLENDLNILTQSFVQKWAKTNGEIVDDAGFTVTDIIEEDRNATLSHYPFTTVLGKFRWRGIETKEFPILQLPFVNRFGQCQYKRNFYTIAATSEPSKFITYNGRGELNLMLHARNIRIIYENGKIQFRFGAGGNQKINATTLCYIVSRLYNDMANKDLPIEDVFVSPGKDPLNYYKDRSYTALTPDINSLLQQIKTPDNIKWLFANEDKMDYYEYYSDDEQTFTSQLNYPKSLFGMFGLVDNATNGINADKLYTARQQLNALLSIDRGENRYLSRDVISPITGETLAVAGDLVTPSRLGVFNANYVNCYYVKSDPILMGDSILAVNIGICKIFKGTYIPINFRLNNEYLLKDVPDITDRDYEFDNPFGLPVIQEGSILDQDTIDLIYNSVLSDTPVQAAYIDSGKQVSIPSTTESRVYYSNTCIPVKTDSNSDKFKLSGVVYISLEEEILGNRHFSKKGGSWEFVTDYSDGFKVLPPSEFLTLYDILAIMSIMPRLNTQYLNRVSDRDKGMRKKYCLIDDHIHKAFGMASDEFANIFVRTLYSWGDECTETGILEKKFKRLSISIFQKLGSQNLKVLTLADTTNPASLTSYMNRINTNVGSKHGVSDSMRFLSLGFYGRICPYETPASYKLGLTNTKAINAEIRDGKIYTNYYQVTRIGNSYYIDRNNVISLSVEEEEGETIADIMSFELDDNYKILNTDDYVIAKVPSTNKLEKMEIQNVPISEVTLVTTEPDQSLSPTATLIPFIGSNDSTRVTYGLNMARQTRPLVKREIPLVFTKGNIDILRSCDYFQALAEADGTVVEVSYSNANAFSKDTTYRVVVEYTEPVLWYNKKMEKFKRKFDPYSVAYTGKMIEYGYHSVIERKIEVREGDFVRKGDILMSSNYTVDGIYAPGVNALVGVVPIGYNYEDGVQIADRLAERFTSYGHTSESYTVKHNTSADELHRFCYIYNNNTRLFKLHENEQSSNPYLMSNGLCGYVVSRGMKKNANEESLLKSYVINTIYLSKMHDGDKTANRHGNKGVVPSILSNSKMLYLSNGEFLDVCYNPAGFASRMNLGQLKELLVGLAAKVLGIHIGTQSFNELEWEDQVKIIDYAYICANEGVDVANSDPRFSKYPASFKSYVKSRERLIMMWKDVFTPEGTAYLIDPRNGHQLHNRVVVGVNYVMKLVQEVDEKVHARGAILSRSRYDDKFARPTHGANRGGGQTMGTMELNALMAYGMPDYVYELLHERGDDPAARQLKAMKLLGTDENMQDRDLQLLDKSRCRRSVVQFVNMMAALGVDVEIKDAEDGIVDVNRVDPNEQFLYSTGAVLGTSSPIINKEEEKQKEEFNASKQQALSDFGII